MDELPSYPLPADLLLDILARCDPTTIIRCAATCKPWYRSITAPAFPGLLRTHAGGRPVTCLAGWFGGRDGFTAAAAESPVVKTVRSFLSRNAALLEPFDLVASRGDLVLFRREVATPVGRGGRRQCCLWICNPVTGWRRSIPSPEVYGYDQAHVLLAGDDAGGGRSSFRLVAVDLTTLRSYGDLSFQTFTASTTSLEAEAEHGGGVGACWSPVTELSPPEDFERVVNTTPVVLGRVAHWLFRTCGEYNVLALALDADGAARRACIDLPPESALRSGAISRKQMLLSSTADGRLSVIAGEETRISVWAHTVAADGSGGSGGWSLHATYEREWIARFVSPRTVRRKPGYPVIDFLWSARGGVVMSVHGFGGRVLLNMETNEIELRTQAGGIPYEVDLASLTAAMKSF
ncbi:unnamed protein product [Urochloa decumbens]|uniref:F-box domain-containing protein n=1 Tax=Urochloa decumbens TaxID=240449 RepID=A0ABC8YHI1_9POAL